MQLIQRLSIAFLGATFLASSTNAAGAELQGLETMLNGAGTSYRAMDNSSFSVLETNALSNRLLGHTHFSMTPAPLDDEGQAFFHSQLDPTAMLHIDTRTRSLAFHMGTLDIGGARSTPALPSVEEAPTVARTLLTQLGLAPQEAQQMVIEHVGGLNMGVQGPAGETEVFEKLRTVRFGRVLEGKRVLGRGSRVVVHMGEAGELRGVTHRWRELQPVAVAPERKFSPQELREMIEFRIRRAASHAKEIGPLNTELVLYDDGLGVIEPVIRVELELTIASVARDENGESVTHEIVNPLDFFVPVLRNSKVDLPFVKDLRFQGEKPLSPQ